MAERNFNQLIDAQAAKGNHLSVGIDIDWAKVDESFGSEPTEEGLFRYGTMVMDETADVAAMFKPNQEFYAAYREQGGLDALAGIVDYGITNHPDIPVTVDAKQGDIGRTNEMALIGVFDQLGNPDAMTIHPWMGSIAMKTHWEKSDKGFFVIAKTSNPGSGELQDIPVSEDLDIDAALATAPDSEQQAYLREQFLNDGLDLNTLLGNREIDPTLVRFRPFWQVLVKHVTSPKGWNANGNMGPVIGATYEEEARSARQHAGESIILSPGLGTQGGKIVDMRNSKGSGVVYNSSSGVMLPKSENIDKHGSVRSAINHSAKETHRQIQEALELA
jgi:orotidine-5'-phosphate decarboxylase